MGGFFAEKWEATHYTVGALVVSGLFLVGVEQSSAHPILRYILIFAGIASLQSATPGALIALKTVLPTRPAVAAGLGFGFAIALGGLPDLLRFNIQALILPIALLSALLFYIAARKSRIAALSTNSC